jgi:hypothetical protein
MDKHEFIDYIEENYSISGEAKRLICNILDFVESHALTESEAYNMLTDLLDGTIGLSDREIKMVCL